MEPLWGEKPLNDATSKSYIPYFEENALMFTNEGNISHNINMMGSTDMGDPKRDNALYSAYYGSIHSSKHKECGVKLWFSLQQKALAIFKHFFMKS